MQFEQPWHEPDQQQVIIPSPDPLGTTKKLIVGQNQPGIYPYPDSFYPTELQNTQQNQQTPQPAMPPTRPLGESTNKLRAFFDFSPQFARDHRFSLFRGCGIVLNILSGIIIVLVLQNVYSLFGGLLGIVFSSLMFALCVRAVEEALAIFFGILVAAYWGGIGWLTGSFIAASLRLDAAPLALYLSLLTFSISLGLHVWYVLRKNL